MNLEVVVGLDVVARVVELLVVDLLDVPQRLTHLVLPELAVLVGRVAVRQRRQLLQLLSITRPQTRHAIVHIRLRPSLPLSSDRQHLSYGVCLEVRGEIIRTVLCCIAYDSCAQA